ncbi:Holliday junction branch migration protein RuvA [Convivina praedatoris]|uniref:Holliday junction branch migration complex subunit RuvA n=1 Tax=Convivina praedatoris TaxID=2880963 RepID=A0ABN8H765_9LACO|nr:Holliday junction branch migration protein RuvA [Convivina sp. LMG 32447]CAH1850225.1 Holliday junction ATP-dependent DNA helicase RuvA [Convivina sp. LMG 32447]CAH1850232.1 Holliday junction ATP-dependent DNA helicase RuvA [Convivina sp. LMG 32447]CAH1850978.1 Holliday junction ATP-dependent DNA helicase RuvA [Convivina sp. LMG 32447]
MYEYLQGLISMVRPSHIVLESKDGIGYYLFVGNPYHFEEGQQSRVYVQQIVRENEISLYGFSQESEKILFNKLLGVSGIGPKSALAIIAGGAVTGLASAVAQDNVDYLVQFPGIGKKTAQQIILDLKGKLDDLIAENQTLDVQPAGRLAATGALEDALEALLTLGYSSRDISRIKRQLLAANLTSTQDYIALALKLLVKS